MYREWEALLPFYQLGHWRPASIDLSMMPNNMRLRRLSRVEGPPHSCAPETSPVQPLSVRSHSWSTVPGSGPPKMSVSSYRWRPQTASLIHRSDPVPPFSSRRCSSTTLPCTSRPGRPPLTLPCRAVFVAFPHHNLAACESEIPCPSCCISIGLDFRVSPCSKGFDCSTTDHHPCLFVGWYEEYTI
jgi:hypothetical protein